MLRSILLAAAATAAAQLDTCSTPVVTQNAAWSGPSVQTATETADACAARCCDTPTCNAWFFNSNSQQLGGFFCALATSTVPNPQPGNPAYSFGVIARAVVEPSVAWIALWIGFAATVSASVVALLLSYIRNVKPE